MAPGVSFRAASDAIPVASTALSVVGWGSLKPSEFVGAGARPVKGRIPERPHPIRCVSIGSTPRRCHGLQTNFLKTELELGHCLRTPAEGPCECDLVLTCSEFLTTSDYAPRPKVPASATWC